MVRSAGDGRRRATVVVLTLIVAACATSGSTYVANRDLGTYLRLPASYTLYDNDAVMAAAGGPPAAAPAQEWVVSFDASDPPRVDAFVNQVREPGDAPSGFVRVRELRDQERLGYSLASLRSEVLSEQEAQALGGRVQILSARELSQEGGDGLDVVWSLRLGAEAFQFEQVALVGDQTKRVYLLVVGCSAACYEAHSEEIADIVESWTVQKTD